MNLYKDVFWQTHKIDSQSSLSPDSEPKVNFRHYAHADARMTHECSYTTQIHEIYHTCLAWIGMSWITVDLNIFKNKFDFFMTFLVYQLKLKTFWSRCRIPTLIITKQFLEIFHAVNIFQCLTQEWIVPVGDGAVTRMQWEIYPAPYGIQMYIIYLRNASINQTPLSLKACIQCLCAWLCLCVCLQRKCN